MRFETDTCQGMRMMRACGAALALRLAVALCSGCPPVGAQSERPAQQLTGGELLLGLAKVGPGAAVPGVYAHRRSGELQRVVSHGEYPAWDRAHRRIALEREQALWVLDRATGRLQQVQVPAGWLGGDLLVAAPFVRPAYEWTATGNLLLWYAWHMAHPSMVGTTGAPVTRRLPFKITKDMESPGEPLINHPKLSIGAVTFSGDGKLGACEAYLPVVGVGRSDCAVLILSTESDGLRRLGLDGLEGTVVCNPLWNPTKSLLSVDVVSSGRTRQTLIVDPAVGGCWSLPYRSPLHNWSAAAAWSPDGRYLIAAQGPGLGLQERVMVVFDLADHEHPKPMRAVAGAFYHHQAVWAPDSLSLAVLQSQDGDLARDFAPVVVVADLSGKASPIAVPRGLRPVSLSW